MARPAITSRSVHQRPVSRLDAPPARPAAPPTDLRDWKCDRNADPRLSALSAAITQLAEGHGRYPTRATSLRLHDRCAVTLLEGFLTPAEQAVIGQGDAQAIHDLRYAFAVAITEEFLGAAARALGREIVHHVSELYPHANACVEIFLLAPPHELAA